MTHANATRRFATVFVMLLGSLYVASAAAQWAWKEESGRVVYSDRPPPANVKIQILRQPANSAPISSPAAGSETKGAEAASGPKSLAEREMEFRKRQQERADSERKAQEEQQKSQAKSENCERARGYLRSLEDGIRIAKTDASGNREFLDDAQRAAEMDKTRKIMQSSCN